MAIRRNFFMKRGKHWTGMSRAVVESLSLWAFKRCGFGIVVW